MYVGIGGDVQGAMICVLVTILLVKNQCEGEDESGRECMCGMGEGNQSVFIATVLIFREFVPTRAVVYRSLKTATWWSQVTARNGSRPCARGRRFLFVYWGYADFCTFRVFTWRCEVFLGL